MGSGSSSASPGSSGAWKDRLSRAGRHPGLLAGWVVLLVLAPGSRSPVAASPIASIELVPVEAIEATPGRFATAAVEVFNPSQESIDLVLRIVPPDGWVALTEERPLRLEGGADLTVPFTVWVPPFSRAETPYGICFQASAVAGGPALAESALPLRVTALTGLQIDLAIETARARPGETARHAVRVRNSGNCATRVDWFAGSIPSWRLDAGAGSLLLDAGTETWVQVGVRVPSDADAGAHHLLDLTFTATPLDGRALPVTERAQARTIVSSTGRAPGRHATLPIEASLSTGEIRPGAHGHGLRLATRGEAFPGGELEAEVDLVSGQRAAGVGGWQRQHWSAAMSASGWKARAGDVIGVFPDLAMQPATLRGGGVEVERPFGTIRVTAGQTRSARAGGNWGLGLARPVGAIGTVTGDFILRDAEGAMGAGRTALLCLSALRPHDAASTFRLETSLSRASTPRSDIWGAAAQFFYDRHGERLQARGRALLGGSGYAGRVHDRDGLSGYVLYLPAPGLRLWSSLDAADGRSWPEGHSPRLRTIRYRAGARHAHGDWPALEINASIDRDRAARADTLRDLDRRAFGAALSRVFGDFLLSSSGQWGGATNMRTGRSGATRTLDLVCGGRFRSVRTALQLQHTDDWNPEVSSRLETTNWTADLGWSSPSGRVQSGLALSTRQVRSSVATPSDRRDHRIGPRLDVGLRPGVRLRADVAFSGYNRGPELERWQLQLSFSGQDYVPLPWRPVRGEIHGVLFIDEDGDNEPDAAEQRVPGVVLRVDGRTLITDERGVFELPALDPGSYWVELNRSSLPAAYVPREPIPVEIRIEPGDARSIRIALVPSGSVSGRIFLDSDHDGQPGPGEEGMRDLRVLLLQDGARIADGLTDAEGRYRIPEVPPGRYEVAIADGWLPRGWIITTEAVPTVQVGAGARAEAPPCGLSPRPRPVIRTYQGGGD